MASHKFRIFTSNRNLHVMCDYKYLKLNIHVVIVLKGQTKCKLDENYNQKAIGRFKLQNSFYFNLESLNDTIQYFYFSSECFLPLIPLSSLPLFLFQLLHLSLYGQVGQNGVT